MRMMLSAVGTTHISIQFESDMDHAYGIFFIRVRLIQRVKTRCYKMYRAYGSLPFVRLVTIKKSSVPSGFSSFSKLVKRPRGVCRVLALSVTATPRL